MHYFCVYKPMQIATFDININIKRLQLIRTAVIKMGDYRTVYRRIHPKAIYSDDYVLIIIMHALS